MDAGDSAARHREQTERVIGAEILFAQERKAGEVLERPQIIRMHPLGGEAALVVRDVLPGMTHRPAQPFKLQLSNLSDRRALLGRAGP